MVDCELVCAVFVDCLAADPAGFLTYACIVQCRLRRGTVTQDTGDCPISTQLREQRERKSCTYSHALGTSGTQAATSADDAHGWLALRKTLTQERAFSEMQVLQHARPSA